MFDDQRNSPNASPEEQQGMSLLAVLPGYPSRDPTPLPRPIGSGATSMPMSASTSGNSHGGSQDMAEDLRQARREIELLKSMDPFHAAEMAIELQVERMRYAEAVGARDSAVQRLASAYDSIKEKVQTIGRIQSEKAELEYRLSNIDSRIKEAADEARAGERHMMEGELARLREIIKSQKESVEVDKENRSSVTTSPVETTSSFTSPVDDASSCSTAVEGNAYTDNVLRSITNGIDHLAINPRPQTNSSLHDPNSNPSSSYLKLVNGQELQKHRASVIDPIQMMRARNSVLCSLPAPSGIPDEELQPIMLPASLTIYEFLGSTTGSLKNSLGNYRTLHENTTRWCPEREEHGFFLTPLYKCTTKARVPTAHSWNEIDPKGQMTRPTECFYNRQGKWYYAGQYIAVRLDDFSTKEWDELDAGTSAMLVKETLAARQNTSPTVHYEVSQLYSAGALKIACVGLQCVGFNSGLYHTIMEQATKCRQSGRWKTGWGGSDFPTIDGSDPIRNNGASNYNENAYSTSLFNFM